MRRLWLRLKTWWRWRRARVFYDDYEGGHWSRIEHFDTGGITGPPGTRTYESEPLEHHATVLRDRRGTASR